MNNIKQQWKDEIFKILEKIFSNVQIVFEAENSENSNRFFYDANNYIMGDIIFKVKEIYYTFEFFTNSSKEYRFSDDLKEFWEEDISTGKRTKRPCNWPKTWRNSKQYLDKHNNEYNIFVFVADHINHKGSKNGVYAIEINYIESFFEEYKNKWLNNK